VFSKGKDNQRLLRKRGGFLRTGSRKENRTKNWGDTAGLVLKKEEEPEDGSLLDDRGEIGQGVHKRDRLPKERLLKMSVLGQVIGTGI